MEIATSDVATLAAWFYVAVFAVAFLDAVVPVVPSESVVITGAVLAAQGELAVEPVFLAAALGAVTGDASSYLIGRSVRRRRRGREPTGRTGRAFHWARALLQAYGTPTLITARFVPGGRTATTFTAGFVGMRPRAFLTGIGIGAVVWAGQAATIGYLGGRAFADNLVAGLALGLAAGLAVGGIAELVRSRRRRPPDEPIDLRVPRPVRWPTSHQPHDADGGESTHSGKLATYRATPGEQPSWSTPTTRTPSRSTRGWC